MTSRLRQPRKLDYLFVSLAILVLDQWTKRLVEVHLPPAAAQPVIPGLLNLTHVKNTGVAFGLFASHGAGRRLLDAGPDGARGPGRRLPLLPLRPGQRNRMLLSALALIVGGAIGNLIDRIASGAVTDFIDVYVGTHHWPSFNVADSAITVGIGLMIVDSFRPHPGRARRGPRRVGRRARRRLGGVEP